MILRRDRSCYLFWCLGVAAAWLLPISAARGQPVGAPGGARAAQVQAPPVIQFPAEGLTLEEAVRLTLQHEPAIKVEQAGARFREGVAQEQGGAFDVSLLGHLFYTYRVQELTENRKQAERDKRDRLRASVENNRASAERAQRLLQQLEQVRAAPPGSAQVAALKEISASLGAQLEVIDALIASAEPSARASLLATRQDFLTRTLNELQQNLQLELDAFRTAEQRLQNLGAAPVDEVFYNGGFTLGVSKLFRSGIALRPFFDGGVEGTNYKGKARPSEFGGKGLQDLFTFHLGVDVTLPILRNRGAQAVGAAERAAIIERDASRLRARHQASASALRTIQTYWALKAAQENVAVATRSVELQSKLVELTRQLIAAEELPQAELARVQASEARAQARLRETQQQLHQARVALAIAMGVAATDDEATLPRARDPFPPAPAPAAIAEPQIPPLVATAAERRLDVAAAAGREQAGRVLEASAVFNLRPRLDLVAGTWYTALEERTIARAIDRWVGPSTNLGLQFERPVGNNVLRGQVVQREADAAQRGVTAEDLKRQARLGVIETVRSLQEAVTRVEQAQAALDFYQRTIEAEIERFRTGEATLIDTVVTEQQRTEAHLQLVAAQHELAQLVARLRYETGTLLSDDQVVRENLVTVPAGLGRQP